MHKDYVTLDPIPRLQLTYIEWHDARSANSNWRELDEAREDGIVLVQSIGWVIKETDAYIQLSPNIGVDPDQTCGDMVIPKSAIISRHRMLELIQPNRTQPELRASGA